jgi:hypothetical protein
VRVVAQAPLHWAQIAGASTQALVQRHSVRVPTLAR